MDTKRMVIGCFLVLGMALGWGLEAELTQSLQTKGNPNYYPKPVAIVYVSHSAYALWIIPWIFYQLWKDFSRKGDSKVEDQQYGSPEISPSSEKRNWIGMREKILFKWTIPMCFVIFLVGYTWYLSLAHTAVSVNTVIYNCVTVIVFLISIPTLNEGVSIVKSTAVVLSLIGVFCIFFAPSSDDGEVNATWYGYLLAIISTTLYGSQEVAYKVLINFVDDKEKKANQENVNLPLLSQSIQLGTQNLKEEESEKGEDTEKKDTVSSEEMIMNSVETCFFLGLTGIWNIIIVLGILVIWNYTGLEKFEWPTESQTNLLLLNAFFETSLVFCILLGTIFTSPLFVAIGSLLVIPVTVSLDYFLHSYLLSPLEGVGILFILSGFLCIVFSGVYARKRENKRNEKDLPWWDVLFAEKYFFSKNETEDVQEEFVPV